MVGKKVYIIILNYNGWKETIECLESVLKNNYKNYQIIVVDNDSPNNSMEYIITWADGKQEVVFDENSQLKHLSQPFESKPLEYIYYTKEEALQGGNRERESKLNNPIVFIQSGENGGFAAGNNIGIKYALTKEDLCCVWLLNNDTLIKRNTLSNLYKCYKNNENSLISSRLLNYDGRLQADGGIVNKHILTSSHINYNKTISKIKRYKTPDYLVGASLFINKKILQDIGLLSEEYFLYYEDLDYSLRVIRGGYKLKVCYKSIVYHKDGASTKKSNKSFIIKRYFENRLRIARNFNFNINMVKIGIYASILKRLLHINLKEAKTIWQVLKNV